MKVIFFQKVHFSSRQQKFLLTFQTLYWGLLQNKTTKEKKRKFRTYIVHTLAAAEDIMTKEIASRLRNKVLSGVWLNGQSIRGYPIFVWSIRNGFVPEILGFVSALIYVYIWNCRQYCFGLCGASLDHGKKWICHYPGSFLLVGRKSPARNHYARVLKLPK